MTFEIPRERKSEKIAEQLLVSFPQPLMGRVFASRQIGVCLSLCGCETTVVRFDALTVQ